MKELSIRNASAALVLAAAIALMCGGCANASYQEGVTKADEEISMGAPCIYTISMADVGHKEPRTGLPYLVLESPVTPELLKMIEGHNATIYARYRETTY